MHLLIKQYFKRKQKANPRYSLRALARDLKVSPAFISNLLNGKKKIPFGMLSKLARILDIDDQEVLALKETYMPADESLRQTAQVKKKLGRKKKWKLGERVDFGILKHWYYIPVLELISCLGSNTTPEIISDRLSLNAAEVETAISDLTVMGLLEKNVDGTLRKSENFLKFASASSREDIRRFHAKMLEKAQNILKEKKEAKEFKRRLITGVTVTASPEKIETAKKMLADALQEIAEFLTEEPGTEVYQVAAQLFPLSK